MLHRLLHFPYCTNDHPPPTEPKSFTIILYFNVAKVFADLEAVSFTIRPDFELAILIVDFSYKRELNAIYPVLLPTFTLDQPPETTGTFTITNVPFANVPNDFALGLTFWRKIVPPFAQTAFTSRNDDASVLCGEARKSISTMKRNNKKRNNFFQLENLLKFC